LFNSVDTCRKVAALGYGIYGTMRMNNRVPHTLQEIMATMKEKGTSHVIMSPQDNLLIWAWMDSKAAVCITNCHQFTVVATRRRMKGRTDRPELPCPLPFSEYNMNMGAIDDFDCLMSFMSVRLRCRKWWHAIFYFLVDVALINSLHLWRQANMTEMDEFTRRAWLGGLVEEIIAKYGDRKGCKWVQGIDEPEAEAEEERPAEKPG
jgi:hypothetical protein